MATQTAKETPHIVVRGSAQNFQQEITAGKHDFVADEPVSAEIICHWKMSRFPCGTRAFTQAIVRSATRRTAWLIESMLKWN
jgi:hypothetical protein